MVDSVEARRGRGLPDSVGVSMGASWVDGVGVGIVGAMRGRFIMHVNWESIAKSTG